MYAKLIYAFGRFSSYRLETDDEKIKSICKDYTDVHTQVRNEKLQNINGKLKNMRLAISHIKNEINQIEKKPLWIKMLNIKTYRNKRESLYKELKALNESIENANNDKNHLENADNTLMYIRFATKHLKEHGYVKIRTTETVLTTEYWKK